VSTAGSSNGKLPNTDPIITIAGIIVEDDDNPSVTKMIVAGNVQNYDGLVDIEFYNELNVLVGRTGWLSLNVIGDFYGFVFQVVQNDGTWTTIVNLDDGTQLSETFYVEKRILNPTAPYDPIVGGTFIPINTTALLLAQVQSISIWMIPVLAGGVGIGVFMIKRKK